MTENPNVNQQRQYINSLKLAALNCRLLDKGDDTDDWRSRILVYAGGALTLSRWRTQSIDHLFEAIGFRGDEMYASAAREFEYAAAAAEKEGRENLRGCVTNWNQVGFGLLSIRWTMVTWSVTADEKMIEKAGVDLTRLKSGHHLRGLRGGARHTLLNVGQVKGIYEMEGGGRSIRGIADDLGVALNTVRRYLKSPDAMRPKPRARRARVF